MTKGNQLKGATLLITGLALSGCAGLTHQKDEAKVGQVRKAAIVAISVFEPAAAQVGLNLGSGKLEGSAGGTLIPQTDTHVDAMFTELSNSLRTNLKWNVMDKAAMVANSGYAQAYEKTMKGWQNKMPPGQGMKQFNVTQVMDFDGPRILDFKGREALIQSLGVDAIVVARLSVVLNANTVMGIGSRKPQTHMSFFVYGKGEEKPIWFEGQIKGEEMQSVGKTAFIDEKLLGDLALKSAKTAFNKIGTTDTK